MMSLETMDEYRLTNIFPRCMLPTYNVLHAFLRLTKAKVRFGVASRCYLWDHGVIVIQLNHPARCLIQPSNIQGVSHIYLEATPTNP